MSEQMPPCPPEFWAESIRLAHTSGKPHAWIARELGIQLEVVRLPAVKRGFVLLPRRWVVERSFAWLARFFRRLARDYERLPTVLAGLHFIAFACLLLHQVIPVISRPEPALGALQKVRVMRGRTYAVVS